MKEARRSISGIVTPGQLALPGMAVDRTPQEQQAINYAELLEVPHTLCVTCLLYTSDAADE